MSVPKPSKAIQGHCATLNDNKLYVFDQNTFQSLPIKENATWSEEKSGQPVSGAACVKAVPDGDESNAAFYVIGGDTDDSEYSGLQRYHFGNQSWETLTSMSADIIQSRTNHSAVYLNDSAGILVYAGSQPDAPSQLSSQTFLISTEPPYNIRSFISHAPPANSPILQPWNSSHAVMVGGQETNTGVWLFSPDDGWQQLSTKLSEPLNPASRAVVIDGIDGSKVLQVYNMHVSPNTAQGIVLLGANGQPASTGQTVGNDSSSQSSSNSSPRKRKRDLTLDNWPSYNNTNAPTSTRADCSLSKNSDGLVVMAGGNDEHPIVMYNEQKNSWVDAGKFFNREEQQPLVPTSSSPSSPTPTESVPSSSTSAASGSGGGSSHDRTMRTLGITLGVLCGIAAIFIFVLLYLRWRKLKAKKKNGGGVEEKDGDGNGRMSFQDRGASFMKEAGMSTSELMPPSAARYNQQSNSHSSLAIIAGKIGNRGIHHGPKDSFESTTHLVKDKNGNIVPTENHEMMDIGDKVAAANASNLTVPGAALDKETRTERKRSSGWSKYFATSAPTGPNGLSHLPSAYANQQQQQPPQNAISVASEYSEDRPSQTSRIPSSALVPPLDVDFSKTVDGQRLSHVAQGSPAFFDSREDLAKRGSSFDVQDGQRGVIVDPARKSQATSIDSFGHRSTLSSGVSSQFYNESGHTPWTPMSGQDRAPSSVYTESVYDERKRRPSRGKGTGFFPGAGTEYRPPKIKLGHTGGPSAEWASPKMPAAQPAQGRDSTVTVFPGADYLEERSNKKDLTKPQASQASPAGGHRQSPSQPVNGDMSWLNLRAA